MGTIRKFERQKGRVVYNAQVRLKGHPKVSASFRRKTDAEKWIKVTEAAMLEGRHFKTVEARNRTFNDLAARYLEQVAPHKKDVANRRRHLEWWAGELGQLCLSDVTASRIAEGRDKLMTETTHMHKKRSASTAVRYLASLSHAFTMAVREWEWLEANPVKRVTRPKTPRGRVRFLSDDELARLMAACNESHHPYIKTIVLTAVATGMRRGEILGLTWGAVDFERSRVTLEHTKNGERRVIPLASVVIAALREHGRVRRLDTDLLFPGRQTDAGTVGPVNIRKAWLTVSKAAQLEDFKFHDLRHTTASYLAMNNASMLQIADVLGHKTLAMVKRYAHLSEAHTATELNAMADRFL